EKVIQRIGSLRLAGGLRADQLPAECVGDATSDLVLYGEEIPDIVVETLRPKMRVGCRINKLRIDPDLVPRAPDTPLEHIPHPKLAADLLGVDALVFVREGRVARDDQNMPQARQIGRQIVGDAVGDILLSSAFAEIVEG